MKQYTETGARSVQAGNQIFEIDFDLGQLGKGRTVLGRRQHRPFNEIGGGRATRLTPILFGTTPSRSSSTLMSRLMNAFLFFLAGDSDLLVDTHSHRNTRRDVTQGGPLHGPAKGRCSTSVTKDEDSNATMADVQKIQCECLWKVSKCSRVAKVRSVTDADVDVDGYLEYLSRHPRRR